MACAGRQRRAGGGVWQVGGRCRCVCVVGKRVCRHKKVGVGKGGEGQKGGWGRQAGVGRSRGQAGRGWEAGRNGSAVCVVWQAKVAGRWQWWHMCVGRWWRAWWGMACVCAGNRCAGVKRQRQVVCVQAGM